MALQVRPRGWHLWERHVLVDGRPVPGGLFDFAVFFYHNAKPLLSKGSGERGPGADCVCERNCARALFAWCVWDTSATIS